MRRPLDGWLDEWMIERQGKEIPVMTTTKMTDKSAVNSKILTSDDAIARGVLLESHEHQIVLAIPRTDYRLHLVPTETIETPIGKAITGFIDVNARRIDHCRTGGNFIEPVYGSPRTVQGRVRAIDAESNTLIVQAKVPVRVKVRAPQNASDFEPGTLITFFIDPGATFTPVSPKAKSN